MICLSVFVKKFEVLEKVKKHQNDVFHLFWDEVKDFWYFTLCNSNQEEDFFGIFYSKEAIRFLLDYFIWKRNISLDGNMDTIRVSYREKLLGYIRFLNRTHVVEEKPLIVEQLLYQVLQMFEEEYKAVHIIHNPKHLNGSILTFSGSSKGKNFVVESFEDQTSRMDYLLQTHANNNSSCFFREDDRDYYFGNISFGKEGLLNEKKYLLNIYQARGYQDGQNASLMRTLYQAVQDANRRKS